eukprot:evm.model.scf_2308.3 EVM.evm.TU.scf_2308.3   scf_2308:22547-24051(-)
MLFVFGTEEEAAAAERQDIATPQQEEPEADVPPPPPQDIHAASSASVEPEVTGAENESGDVQSEGQLHSAEDFNPDDLWHLKVVDLKRICKDTGIPNYSKCKKQELIDLITQSHSAQQQ